MSASNTEHHGFNWWSYAHNEYLETNPHVASALSAILVMLIIVVVYKISVGVFTGKNENELVPSPKFGISSVLDALGAFVQDMAKSNIGHGYEPYLPLLIFIFFWTFVHNFLGNIPGFGSATSNLNSTLSMGVVVFFYYNVMGFKIHGLKYLEHFTGHLSGVLLLCLGPLMFVIEIISHVVRPVSLGIRLRSNIYGDHTVFGIISDLVAGMGHFFAEKLGVVGDVISVVTSSLLPVPIMILGLLVCLIQAVVFTLLTSVYIGMAVAHGDDHH